MLTNPDNKISVACDYAFLMGQGGKKDIAHVFSPLYMRSTVIIMMLLWKKVTASTFRMFEMLIVWDADWEDIQHWRKTHDHISDNQLSLLFLGHHSHGGPSDQEISLLLTMVLSHTPFQGFSSGWITNTTHSLLACLSEKVRVTPLQQDSITGIHAAEGYSVNCDRLSEFWLLEPTLKHKNLSDSFPGQSGG